jgi:hypothetical protein
VSTLGALKDVASLGGGKLAKLVKDKLWDKIKDEIKKYLKTQKPEVYYYSRTLGGCSIVMLAIWDKAAGTYEIVVYGDCKCTPQLVPDKPQQQRLATFAVRFTGRAEITVSAATSDITLVIGEPKVTVSANCDVCRQPQTGTATPATPPPPPAVTPQGPTSTAPRPLPPRDVKTSCLPCQGIVDDIRRNFDALDDNDRAKNRAAMELNAAKSRNEKDEIARAQAEYDRLATNEKQIEKLLRDLFEKLKACEQENCGTSTQPKETPSTPATPKPAPTPQPGTAPKPPVTPPEAPKPAPQKTTCPACEDKLARIKSLDAELNRLSEEQRKAAMAGSTEGALGTDEAKKKARDRAAELTREIERKGEERDRLNDELKGCERSCVPGGAYVPGTRPSEFYVGLFGEGTSGRLGLLERLREKGQATNGFHETGSSGGVGAQVGFRYHPLTTAPGVFVGAEGSLAYVDQQVYHRFLPGDSFLGTRTRWQGALLGLAGIEAQSGLFEGASLYALGGLSVADQTFRINFVGAPSTSDDRTALGATIGVGVRSAPIGVAGLPLRLFVQWEQTRYERVRSNGGPASPLFSYENTMRRTDTVKFGLQLPVGCSGPC